MPIVVVTGGQGPPVVLPDSPLSIRNQPLETPAIIITDNTGDQVVLGADGDPYALIQGMTGFGLAPTSLYHNALPESHGSLFRGVRLNNRDLFIPVNIFGDDYTSLQAARRRLEHVLDPLRGDITVTISHPGTGEQRHATGRYDGGLDGATYSDVFGNDWQRVGLLIRCFDPFWYGPATSKNFRVQGTNKPLLSTSQPFFPIKLASSQVLGSVTINNPGDSDTFPLWAVKGPGSGFEATNGDRSFEITGTIDAARTITIDTRRHLQTVVDDLGANLWSRFTPGGSLWSLQPGVNNVTLALGSATADSLVTVAYSPRYRSAM